MASNACRYAALSAVLLAVGACSIADPYERAGVWRPRGSNNGNLAVMVENPNDLISGRGVDGSNGVLAANAVERLYQDKVKTLPDTSLAISPINGGGSGGGSGSGGGGSGDASGGSSGSGTQ